MMIFMVLSFEVISFPIITTSLGARLTQIYVALANYTREAVRENAVALIPVMRPLFLMYEADPRTFEEDYEYMYGNDLLVAPVLDPGLDEWAVYLPKGEVWVHLWTKEEMEGGLEVLVPAPLGNPPVFYRKGSNWSSLFDDISSRFS